MTHEAKKEYLKNQNFGSEMLRRCVKEKNFERGLLRIYVEVKVSNFLLSSSYLL